MSAMNKKLYSSTGTVVFFVFTKTWFIKNIPDSAIQVDGLALYHPNTITHWCFIYKLNLPAYNNNYKHILLSVYIPPTMSAKEVLSKLYNTINELQNIHPDILLLSQNMWMYYKKSKCY